MAAEILAREIANLRAKEQTTDTIRAIEIKQWSLDQETEANTKLGAFHADTRLNWSQKKSIVTLGTLNSLRPSLSMSRGALVLPRTGGVFAAAEGKIKDTFEGSVVYLGAL